MFVWLLLRYVKYHFFMPYDTASRYLWYLYYVPQCFVPPLTLIAALGLTGKSNRAMSKYVYLLLVPAFILVILILTNDLHQTAFVFGKNFENFEEVYDHGALYYVTMVWIGGVMAAVVVTLFVKCSISACRQKVWVPIAVAALCTLAGTLCFMFATRSYKVPELFIFSYILIITANVPTGKDFVMWSFEGFAPDGLTLTNPELTFTMPANAVTATAVFEDINYEVKVICRNTETKTAHYGEEVTITAENIEGKIFVCWEFTNLDAEGLDLTRAELSFTMPANNVTAKAIYEELITLTFEGTTAQSEELQYKDNDSKSFRLPLGSGQDLCTYTIELSNSAFTFKVYGSDGVEIEPYDNGDGFMCIDIEREDNYTIRVVNTGSAANCTLTVTKI